MEQQHKLLEEYNIIAILNVLNKEVNRLDYICANYDQNYAFSLKWYKDRANHLQNLINFFEDIKAKDIIEIL